MLATVVDTDALFQTIVAALLAGVGTTVVFSIAILGVARFSDATRDGRSVQAVVYGALAIAGLLATVAAIVFGVIVMATK
jgi:MFS-type transporter involved in bile tolerance (Atg22 family)